MDPTRRHADTRELTCLQAEYEAEKLQWTIKDAEAKIAAEKMRITTAKMQIVQIKLQSHKTKHSAEETAKTSKS